MTRQIKAFTYSFFLGLIALSQSVTAESQPLASNDKSIHGSWSYECNKNMCFISQMIMAKQKGKIGIAGGVNIAIASKQRPIMTLRFNKDAHVPAGIGIKVDANPAIRTKILNCDAKVCETNLIMDAKMLDEMQNGHGLQVVFLNNISGKQVTLPFSLSGFSEAYGKLSQQQS
ncbi:invasion associated locus B family protein [Psychrosphaera ytuae]|uniref:Invasion associated locus B family protein n=1 Tax=Psychrosphaera ytuae TaxID=2820710 RepID=A0A975DA06_9GAMM|nr:invasion associated locus B family protein [Psychrosphaera ytuae]QTH63291.1 invasion associated locus B family protein [Psychrosphaera ytuae]